MASCNVNRMRKAFYFYSILHVGAVCSHSQNAALTVIASYISSNAKHVGKSFGIEGLLKIIMITIMGKG